VSRWEETVERSRDLIAGDVTLDYFLKRAAEGWRLAAIEWVRESARPGTAGDYQPVEPQAIAAELPYALQIASDGQHLESNPLERTVLLLILEKIIHEKRITQIATELNAAGHRTRKGMPWTPSDVFNLLPRVIEAGPELLKSDEWQHRYRSPHTV
jgi:hypothetical protein